MDGILDASAFVLTARFSTLTVINARVVSVGETRAWRHRPASWMENWHLLMTFARTMNPGRLIADMKKHRRKKTEVVDLDGLDLYVDFVNRLQGRSYAKEPRKVKNKKPLEYTWWYWAVILVASVSFIGVLAGITALLR